MQFNYLEEAYFYAAVKNFINKEVY